MPGMIDFAHMDLRGAFDLAIMVEEDAQVRYEQLAALLGKDPGGAGDVFRMMAVNEGKHRADLEARRAALFSHEPEQIEVSVLQVDVERVGLEGDELPKTGRQALDLALAAERRAFGFYRDLMPYVRDAAVRTFFEGLLQEEAEHEVLLTRKIAALDDAPCRGEDHAQLGRPAAPAVPAETYPDRAHLQSVLPRFDAATRAVATSVIVHGLEQGEVARALGVSRRTVARKLTRFLEIARQYAAVTLVAAALGGCDGGAGVSDASDRILPAEPQRSAEPAPLRRDDRPAVRDDRAVVIAGEQGGEKGVEAEQQGEAAAEHPGSAHSLASDLEFSAGLEEPPQQQIVPAPAPWTPPLEADANPKPVIEDVWPDKGPTSGGDRVVIRGRNLEAAQVLFGLTPATILSASEDELTVATPAVGVGEVPIVVTNRDGNYAISGGVFRFYS